MDLKEIEREGEYDQDILYKMLRELIKIRKKDVGMKNPYILLVGL